MALSPLRGLYPKLALAGLGLFVLGPILAVTGLVTGFPAFVTTVAGAGLGVIAAFGGVVYLLQRARRPGLFSLFVGLIPLAAFAIGGLSLGVGKFPRINDISTDLADPPALVNGAAYPGEFVAVQQGFYTDLGPLKTKKQPDEAFAAAVTLIQDRDGWTITHQDPEARTILGSASTSIFRFIDDFAVRVRASVDGAVVDMRSRSRSGESDLGANAARIQAFFVDLGHRLGDSPGD